MGGQSNMGGATQATQGTGMQPFDLSKLFMGNSPTSQATGGMQLPQIQAPVRPPMPTMPVRQPLPQVAPPPPEMDRIQKMRQGMMEAISASPREKWLDRNRTDNR